MAILAATTSLLAQVKPDGQKAFEIVEYLASDAFKGRKSGTPEYRKAAEYVAAKMEDYGLWPGGEDGTYFQEVVFKDWNNFDQPIRLEVTEPQHCVYFAGRQMDYSPVRGTGSGTVQGQLVFAGYGIVSEDSTWNDYAHIDATGKIVLIGLGVPDSLGKEAEEEWTVDKKIKMAVDRGAVGAILMTNIPQSQSYRWWRRLKIEKETCPEGFVVMSANKSFLDHVFYLDNQSWRYLVSKTLRQQKSFTTSLNVTVEMEAHYTLVDSLTAPNVIGIIPGRDRRLKDEYIIVGGHLDHLGVGVDGFIYNGADDNAGSAGVILEMARVFQANRFRPDRTVVLASWAGEELGLIGSKYYTEHPIYPLEKTAVYMNMDMIGCGDEDLYVGGMWWFSDFYDAIKERLDEDMKKRLRYRFNYRGSDHSAFLPKDVTCISLRTGNTLTRELDDEHPEYHCPGDMANIIEPELLELAAQYHLDIVTFLANTKNNLLDPEHHVQFVHKDATVIDLHCDTIGRFVDGEDLSKDCETGHIDIPKLKQGAVDLQVFACFVGPPGNEHEKKQAAENAFRQIDGVHRLVEENPEDLAVVTSYEDFRELRDTNKTGMLIGIEGGYAIESDLSLLRSFYRSGVRLMTLTHWTHTDWADASGDEQTNYCGLTEFGEEVVKEMNKLGMIIDLSHAHDETFWDVLRITDSPVVASHSCCRALTEHHRNVTDTMLKALAENGGMIGINYAPGFLNEAYEAKSNALMMDIAQKYGLPTDFGELMKADPEKQEKAIAEYYARLEELKTTETSVTVKTVVDHIEHVIEVTGSYDHVGLGSDFDGIENTPVGLEHVGKLSNITRELMDRDHKAEDIKKILGENFVRILKDVCGSERDGED